MNHLKISLFLLLLSLKSFAQQTDTRKDSFDVIHYAIHLDVSDFTNKSIAGFTDIKAVSLVNNLDNIRLELFKLKVDSVLQNGNKITYNYNDSILKISLSTKANKADSFAVRVYYHGNPAVDKSGFGGFVFSNSDGGIAYNLGVGFKFIPHNAGRTWFPCVDNFLDKATFSCYILTQKNHKAFCGGLLMDSSFNSTTNLWLWHWELTQNVPTYLASVAVGNYLTQIKKYTNATRTIDMVWGIRPKDSATTKIAFANLTQTLAGFEKCYGNYHFDRVGYVYVPFYGGAMEHATNIAFPPYGFAGKTYESTAAHELSHHWWGDYMTCSSAEDMWLNEGWASYSERIFSENVYGKKAYQDEVRKNHYNVLRFAHHYDKGYHPLTPMPQTFTYGGTVYWKGADVAHSLRGYLGDSLFFKGIKGFLDDFAFKSASSADFKTSLNKHTGKDLTDFFAGWVYAAGFPHFALDSIGISPAGADYKIEVKISQQLKKAPSIYKNTPIEIITIFEDGTMDKNSVLMQDSLAAFTFTKKKKPITAIVDMDAKLSDATTKEYKTIYATGKYSYTESLMDVTVNTINFKDTATLFIAHHWVGAKHGKNLPLYAKISPQRYWTVDGYLPNGFTAKATIGYDGKVGTDFTIGFLDDELIDKTEDSLHLLYRRYPQDDWQEHPDYTKIMGAKTNKTGSITINKLLLGEYTLAMSPKVVIAIEETTGFDTYFKIYPNPAKDFIRIENLGNQKIQSATLLNLKGQIISTVKFSGTEITGLKTINTGIYFVKIETAQGSFVKMLVVE